MIFMAITLGLMYGYIASQGQFCMNSGFSNVARTNDVTKLKSFLTAMLVPMMTLPLLLSLGVNMGFFYPLYQNLQLPPLYLIGNTVGGILFGISMHYAGGCGAGVFFKIGERNLGAVYSSIGFVGGWTLFTKALGDIPQRIQQTLRLEAFPIWNLVPSSAVALSAVISLSALGFLYLIWKTDDKKPAGAQWGWKKTGMWMGVLGMMAWILALMAGSSYSMAIVPGVNDLIHADLSWGLLFLIGLPLGGLVATWNKEGKRFVSPDLKTAFKRVIGGIGLGLTAGLGNGCTLGHGLAFAPFLALGSLVGIFSIFLGSYMVGYVTRK